MKVMRFLSMYLLIGRLYASDNPRFDAARYWCATHGGSGDEFIAFDEAGRVESFPALPRPTDAWLAASSNQQAAAAWLDAITHSPETVSRPQVFSSSAPALVPVVGSNAWLDVRASADGEIFGVPGMASPLKSQVERDAWAQSNIVLRASIITALKALKVDCTNAIAEAQAVDPTAWTGTQRTQAQAIRKAMIDEAQAINALRKQLLRYFKVEEP